MKKSLVLLTLFALYLSCGSEDDSIIEPAGCNAPTVVQTNTITSESAALNWNDTNTSATYSIEYGLTGFAQGSGTTVSSSQSSITLSSLSPNTTYQAYVKAICSVNSQSNFTSAISFTTLSPSVIADFLPNLSDLNIYSDLNDLSPSEFAFVYDLNTALFTDYSQKQRIIALPQGEKLSAINNGLPTFPDNTLIAKTFFYYNNEGDESLGKQIIETRILIKKNGVWEAGNYKWNAAQTDAVLDNTTSNVAITYIDINGSTQNVDYRIPKSTDCTTCHSINNAMTPIGPKLRNLTKNNQLATFIANDHFNSFDPNTINALPDWEDTTYTLEERGRAYMDVNCATCHSFGGTAELESVLRLTYETPFSDSQIYAKRFDIDTRMQTYQFDYSMPLIGVSKVHAEGYNLVRAYMNSL